MQTRRGTAARLTLRGAVAWSALALIVAACERTPVPTVDSAAAPTTRANPAEELRNDDRIAHLMGGCAHQDPFLEDTSAPIPVLVSKLSLGQVDPMRSAREELVRYGAAALPELRRAFDAAYGTPFLDQRVQNIVELLGQMSTDGGREMILRALVHPQQTVRKAAARALQNHARPEDYDLLLEGLALSGNDSQGDFALALIAADRRRVEHQLVEWIEGGQAKSLVDLLAVHLCTTHDRDATAAWRAVLPRTEGKLRVFLQAAVANEPDESALAELRTWLMDTTRAPRRQVVAQALAKVGLARELAPLIARQDSDESLRQIAVQAVAEAPYTDETRDVLRAALADPAPDVRDTALTTLCAHGDPGARDAALEFLQGSRTELETGIKALRVPMNLDEAYARRVLEVLIALHKDELGRGLVDERTLLRTIGQVPLAEAATYIMDVGSRTEGKIQGLSAHRWHAQAAGNTGSAGMAFLRETWRGEPDPARRMDLVMGGSFEKSEAVREFLVEALSDPRASPYELLYAADRLARIGPMATAAPILKRAALRVNEREVRLAFHCLLWNWYGLAT